MANGIIIIDKPADWTSMDVCAKLRGILKTKKIGHAGTLDPMATGVLPVFVGQATRAVSYAESGRKEYVAGLRLGLVTNTQDTSGETLRESPVTVTADELRAVLPQFTGPIEQIPPMFSAIKIGGKKLYELARKGQEVERKSRAVTIYELEVLAQTAENEYLLRILCSKGTYVRTLAHDIGAALGCGGCLTALRRIESGGLLVEHAVTLEQVEALRDSGELISHILPTEQVFDALPVVTVTPEGDERCKNGAFLRDRHLAAGEMPPEGTLCRVRSSNGKFLLVARSEPLEKGGLALFCQTTFFTKD